MSRKFLNVKHDLEIDYKYESNLVHRFINIIMYNGAKRVSEYIIYKVLNLIKINYLCNPLHILYNVIESVRYLVGIKFRKFGGNIYKVPVKVSYYKGVSIAMKLICTNARRSKEKVFYMALFYEIINTYNGVSNTLLCRNGHYNLSILNRAFVYYGL